MARSIGRIALKVALIFPPLAIFILYLAYYLKQQIDSLTNRYSNVINIQTTFSETFGALNANYYRVMNSSTPGCFVCAY